MPFQLFHTLFPKLAEAETRYITVTQPIPRLALPPAQYAFLEMYCDERKCDCRRVLFFVLASFDPTTPKATISWGWEPLDFYTAWMYDGVPETARLLKGPALNPGSPQSELADDLLVLVEESLLRDEAYVERIKRHYRLFRDKIDHKLTLRPHSRQEKRQLEQKLKQWRKNRH